MIPPLQIKRPVLPSPHRQPSLAGYGFTLVELLVSMVVLTVLLAIISQVISTVQRSWRDTSAKVSQFREARRAFDVVKRNLGQATLNTYLQYDFQGVTDPSTGFVKDNAVPTGYLPYSELQFQCGPAENLIPGGGSSYSGHAVFFQAVLGFSDLYPNLPTTINPRGYYVEYGDDENLRPPFLRGLVPTRTRYRLIEYAPPTEMNTVYDDSSREVRGDWYQNVRQWSRPVADNVAAIFFSPKRPTVDGAGEPRDVADRYEYDSALGVAGRPALHELPPQIEIVMVVLDEASAERLSSDSGGGAMPLNFGKFFTQATEIQFRKDIDEMTEELQNRKLNFRIFSSTISLPNSKWRTNFQ